MNGGRSAPQRRTVVVVGMHRSGTSALAGALARLGLALPHDLMPAQGDNPRGFHEPIGIAGLNDRILESAGGAWDRPPTLLPDEMMRWLPEATAAVAASFAGLTAIVLKDPRISLLRPLWDEAMRAHGFRPRYVLIHRNPLDVAASLAARNGLSREAGLRLWLCYVRAALTTGGFAAVVGFEELLAQPQFVLSELAASLALEPSDIDAAAATLDGEDRHYQTGKHAFDEGDAAPAAVKDARWLLRRWHSCTPLERQWAIDRIGGQAELKA